MPLLQRPPPLDLYQDVVWTSGGRIDLWASDHQERPNINTNFYLGSTSFELDEEKFGSRWYENLSIKKPSGGTNYQLQISDADASLDVSRDTSLLLSHAVGFAQQIVSVGSTLDLDPAIDGSDFLVATAHAGGNPSAADETFKQTFMADGQKIGTATYSIGKKAYNALKGYFASDFTGSVDGFDFADTGVFVGENSNGGAGIWMLSILEKLDINRGQTLKIDVPADQSGQPSYWFAATSGAGGLSFVGEGKDSSSLVFAYLDPKKNPTSDDAINVYTGTTYLKDVTATLKKRMAFGRSTHTVLEDAQINVALVGAWADAGDASLSADHFDHDGDVSNLVLEMKDSQIAYIYTDGNGASDQHLYVHGDAVFSGDNVLSGTFQRFFFQIFDDARIDGTLNIVRTDPDGNLLDDGFSEVAMKVHGSATLTRADSLQSLSRLEVGKNLIFSGAEGQFDQKVIGISSKDKDNNLNEQPFEQVLITDRSRLSYAQQSIKAEKTVVEGSSVLSVSADAYGKQLGKALSIDSGSYVYLQGSDVFTVGGLALHGAGFLVAQGSGSTQITLESSMDFSEFSGWLRLENSSLELREDEAHILTAGDALTGVSAGGNSTITLVSKDNSTIKLDKFGFARYDNASQQAGVLDLTGFSFDQEDPTKAALSVNQLQVNVAGTVLIDADKIQLPSNETDGSTDGSILDYDNSDEAAGNLIIRAETVSAEADNIHVEFKNMSDEVASEKVHDIVHKGESSNKKVADGYWGYDAFLKTDAESESGESGKPNGLYLGYLLKRVDLLEGKDSWVEGSEKEWLGVDLDLGASRDNKLSAEITGVGRINVIANADDASDRWLYFTNVANSFQGLVDVREGAGVQQTATNALGQWDAKAGRGTTLRLGKDADYVIDWVDGIASEKDNYTQTLEKMVFSSDGVSEIVLNGNYLTLVRETTFVGGTALKAAGESLDKENAAQANFDSTLILGEGARFEDAKILNGYAGRLELGASEWGGSTQVVVEKSNSSLEALRLSGQGKSIFDLETNAAFSSPRADFTDYSGVLGVGLLSQSGSQLALESSSLGLEQTTLAVGGGEIYLKAGLEAAALQTGVKAEGAAFIGDGGASSSLHFALTDLFASDWSGQLTLSDSADIAAGTTLVLDLPKADELGRSGKLDALSLLRYDGEAAVQTLIEAGSIKNNGLVWEGTTSAEKTFKVAIDDKEATKSYAVVNTSITGEAGKDSTVALSSRIEEIHAAAEDVIHFSRTASTTDESTRELSAKLSGEGLFSLDRGTLIVMRDPGAAEKDPSVYGGFNVSASATSLTFAADQTFTGKSEWHGRVLASDGVHLRLDGATVKADRSALTNFGGQVTLASDSQEGKAAVFAYAWNALQDETGASDELFAGGAAFAVEGDGSRLDFSTASEMAFNTAVKSIDGGSAELALSASDDAADYEARLSLSADLGIDRTGLGALDIAEGATLVIKSEKGTSLNDNEWAEAIKASGEGRLSLDGVKAEVGKFAFDEWSLDSEQRLSFDLVNGAAYAFSSERANIDLVLERGAELLVANAPQGETPAAETRVHDFLWNGTLALDFDEADLKQAQLHVDQLHIKDDAVLKLSASDFEQAAAAPQLGRSALAMDDGAVAWFVQSKYKVTYGDTLDGPGSIDNLQTVMADSADSYRPSSIEAVLAGSVDAQDRVVGTFTASLTDSAGGQYGIGVETALSKATFFGDGRLELQGSASCDHWSTSSSWEHVDVVSAETSAGVINVSDAVGLRLGEGTNFSGSIELEDGASLALAGASMQGAGVHFLKGKTSSLLLSSNQALALHGEAGGQLRFGDENSSGNPTGIALKITGSSALGTEGQFAISGGEADRIALAQDVQLMIGGASSALEAFKGAFVLAEGSALVLRDKTQNTTISKAVSLNRVQDDAALQGEAAIKLESGRYEVSSGAAWSNSFTGAMLLGSEEKTEAPAELSLLGWEGELRNRLEGSDDSVLRIAALEESGKSAASLLTVKGQNAEAFHGTWRVEDNSRFTIEDAAVGGQIELVQSGALELKASGDMTFSNTVRSESPEDAQTRITAVSGRIDASASEGLEAETIAVNAGAELMISKLDQLKSQAEVEVEGTFFLNADGWSGLPPIEWLADGGPETVKELVIDGLTLENQAGDAEGERMFKIAAGSGTRVVFGKDFSTEGFSGTIQLVSGTIRHDAASDAHPSGGGFEKVFESDESVRLALSGQAVFEVAGSAPVALPGGFAWMGDDGLAESSGKRLEGSDSDHPVASAGILDITGYKPVSGAPAMKTSELAFNGGTALIKLDISQWKDSIKTETSSDDYESLLDLDDGGEGKMLVVADEVVGSGAFALVDGKGVRISEEQHQASVQNGLAQGYWNFTAELVSERVKESDQLGVKLGYALTRLDLQNAGQEQAAVVFAEGSDDTFSAWITGNGKIDVRTDTTLSHERNAFAGLVSVAEDATLTSANNFTLSGAPSASRSEDQLVSLNLAPRSKFTIRESESKLVERLGGLQASSDASIALNGNALVLASAQSGSLFNAGSSLSGGIDSQLIIEGAARFADADSALQSYQGEITVLSGGVLTLDQDISAEGLFSGSTLAEELFRLERLSSEGDLPADGMDSLARVEVRLSTALGDGSGFSGLYDVNEGVVLRLDENSKWTDPEAAQGASIRLDKDAVFDAASYASGVRGNSPAIEMAYLEAGEGSRLRLGSVAIGSGYASSAVHVAKRGAIGQNAVIEVAVDPNEAAAEALFELDDGKTAALIVGENIEADPSANVSVQVKGDEGSILFDGSTVHSAALMQDGSQIGEVDYTAAIALGKEAEPAVGLRFEAQAVRLSKGSVWKIDATGMRGKAASETLSIDINSEGAASGGLVVTSGREGGAVALEGSAWLEKLQVSNKASSLAIRSGQLVLQGEGAGSVTAESWIEGQLKFELGESSMRAEGGAQPALVVDGTSLAFRSAQESAADAVRLANGGALFFENIDAGESSIYDANLLETQNGGRVVFSGSKGLWKTNMISLDGEAAEAHRESAGKGLSIDVVNGSVVTLDAENFSGLSSLTVGGEAQLSGAGSNAKDSKVIVKSEDAIGIGEHDGVAVEIGSNGVFHNKVNVTKDADTIVEGWLNNVSGTGRIVIDATLDDGVLASEHFFRLHQAQASDFTGTIAFENISGVVSSGVNSRTHMALAGKAALEAWDNASLVVLGGDAHFAGIRLADETATLDLTKNFNAALGEMNALEDGVEPSQDGYGKTVNFVRMNEDGVFSFAAGAQVAVTSEGVKVNAESINSANQTLKDGDSLVSLLKKNDEAFTHRFFQFLEGQYEGSVEDLRVVDENGRAIGQSVTLRYDDEAGRQAVAFHGGIGVVQGEKEGRDLWIGQKIQGMEIFQDAELFSDEQGGTTITQWIQSAEGTKTGIDVTRGVIGLASQSNSFTGSAEVHAGAELRLEADDALGGGLSGSSVAERLTVAGSAGRASSEGGRAVVAAGKSVQVHAAEIGGELLLQKDSALRLLSGDEDGLKRSEVSGLLVMDAESRLVLEKDASLLLAAGADYNKALGRFSLSEGASLIVDVASDPAAKADAQESAARIDRKLTAAAISGGALVKRGAGALGLNAKQFSSSERSALVIEEGAVEIADWSAIRSSEEGSPAAKAASPSAPLALQRLEIQKRGRLTIDGDIELAQGEAWRHQGQAALSRDASKGFVMRVLDGSFIGGGSREEAGVITFNAALGSGEATEGFSTGISSDHFEITGSASGAVLFDVNDVNGLKSGASERIVLMTVDGSVEGFAPALLTGTIEAGGYSYRLASGQADEAAAVLAEGGELAGGKSATRYYLTSLVHDNPTPGEEPGGSGGGGSGAGGVHAVSPNLGAYLGFAASQSMFDLTIHDRHGTRPYVDPITGEASQTAMWMRQTVSQTHSADASGQLKSRGTQSTTQLGGDVVRVSDGADGLWFAGALAGFGRMDWKTSSSVTTARSRADIDGWAGGFYAGWVQKSSSLSANPSADQTGAYADAWVQYVKLSADFSNAGQSLSADAAGIAASLEAGHCFEALRFVSDDGASRGTVFVEPHAQVIWHSFSYDDFDQNGRVKIEDKDNAVFRLGARTSVVFEGAMGASPYVDLSWVHSTRRNGAVYGAVSDWEEGAKNQLEASFGIDGAFTKSLSGYASFTLNKGSDGYTKREGSIGLRYLF